VTNVVMQMDTAGCRPVAVRKSNSEANQLLMSFVTSQLESATSVDDYAGYFIVAVEDEEDK
jgi:hypothetical protein